MNLYDILCFAIDGRAAVLDRSNLGTKDSADDTRQESGSLDTLLLDTCNSIVIHATKTFAALALTEMGRTAIEELCQTKFFTHAVLDILKLKKLLPLATEAALHLIARASASTALQNAFVEVGCVWLMVPMLVSLVAGKNL